MSSLQKWLNSCDIPSESGRIVLGNQAADLDSMASSIAYGLLCSLLTPTEQPTLPIMPIPRSDFQLRREAVYVFQQAGIRLDDLIFWDEVDVANLPEQVKLVLVDHNALALGLEKLSGRVAGILDHHVDEGLYPAAEPRIIRPVGSCATLVALEFQKNGIVMEADTATLLAGTILLDTVNLDEQFGRVTDSDKQAAAYLLPFCLRDRDEYFRDVQQEKYNVQGLSSNDLLRKDYKEWQFGQVRCGIASVRLSVRDWLAQDAELAAGFAEFADQHGLDLLLSMHSYRKPDFQRELMLFCRTEAALDALYCFLQDSGLKLTALDGVGLEQSVSGSMGAYFQGNIGISRKKLQPLLADLVVLPHGTQGRNK